MGYLNKDAYFNKELYVQRLMANNRDSADLLTDEQCDLLEELCQFRHELHTSWRDAFLTESGNYGYFSNEIGEWGDDGIRERVLLAFGAAPFSRVWYSNDHDYREDEFSTYDEAYEDACASFNIINNEIEDFLVTIDRIHGTHYCPTGSTRIF